MSHSGQIRLPSSIPTLPDTPPDSSSSENFPKEYFTSTIESKSSSSPITGVDTQSRIQSKVTWLRNLSNIFISTQEAPPCEVKPILYYKDFGYRAFCQLIANEQTFFMVRRFGALNARVALFLQDKIVNLSDRLDELDADNTHEDLGEVNNGTFREEHDTRRTELIKDHILPSLIEYNNFVNSYAQLVNRPPVRKEARQEVQDWLNGHKEAIHDEEAAYINAEDDLIAVHPKEKSWFRKMLEWTFVAKLSVFRRDPPGYEYNKSKDLGRVDFQNDGGLEKCSTALIAIIGLAMLIGPLWILNTVKSTEVELGVITGFIALFFILVAVATNAKIFESLAAAAAYSAVLMVFLQMGNGYGS